MPINNLLEIMSRLRDPINGCPWDVVQTFETIAPYTIEEAYEVMKLYQIMTTITLKTNWATFASIVFHSKLLRVATILF